MTNMDAGFKTLRQVKIFGVQAIEMAITLTETNYDQVSLQGGTDSTDSNRV